MYTAVEVLSSLAEQLISYSANAIVDLVLWAFITRTKSVSYTY